jgi:hypothetical protein
MTQMQSLSWSQLLGKVRFFFQTYLNLELGLLDYPQIVKKPMDFATIKKTLLKGGKYETFEDVFNEV